MPTSASPRSRDPSSELAFGLLGPLAVWRNGQEVDLGPPQQRALLTVLLLHRNRPVSIDHIVEAFWPRGAPPSGVQAIRTYASRLRHLLSPDHLSGLRAEAGAYRLLVSSGQTDIDRFEEHASAGRDALDAGDLPTAERHLRAARHLVRGPPLGDALDLPEAHAEAERLDELRLMVEESLVDVQLAQGRHRRVIPVLRALTRSDPHDERFWAQLMLALYRAGRQADALAVYREARTALRDQLGLDPGPELQQLERMILLQERTLDHRAVGLLHGVPRYQTSFVGRADALDDLSRLLRRTRWISIVGPPGVGKSRLAAELAARARSNAPDGVWWVDLEGVSPSSVAGAIGRAVALRESAPERLAGLITARLRGMRALLILDGCDASAAAVARLAQQVAAETEGVRILTTCRRPTRADAEHVYRLRPLAMPAAGGDALAVFATEAGRLLADRAGAAGGSVLTGPLETAQLLRRLDGLPLAIELAAGRLSSLSAMELNRALADDLRLLTPARPGLGAPAPLERALEQSLSALDHAEHRLLLRLSVFGGTFTLEGAKAVAPRGEAAAEITLALTDLVERSLVMAEVGDPTRYRLLATVRSYLSGLRGVESELEEARRQHRDYLLPYAERIAEHMLGPGLPAWLPPASAAHADLLAALQWSLSRHEGEAALQMASALAFLWQRIGSLAKNRRAIKSALALAPARSPWRPRALLALAWASLEAQDPAAGKLARRAAVAAAGVNPEWHALALAALASSEIRFGSDALAEEALIEARREFARVGHEEGQAMTMQLEGRILLRRGDVGGALAALRIARARFRGMRGTLDAGWTILNLSDAAVAAGRLEEARAAATDAVADFRARGDPHGLTTAFVQLGRTYRLGGDPDSARGMLAEARTLAIRHEYPLVVVAAEQELLEIDRSPV